MRNDIMLFDGDRWDRVFRSDWTDQSTELNDSDWITWSHANFCVEPWVAHVPLYRDGSVEFLTREATQYVDRFLNNRGQVVWILDEEAYEWHEGQTRKLDFGGSVLGIRINDRGDCYYYRWYDGPGTFDAWMYRKSGPKPGHYRLTDDLPEDLAGNINDYAEVAWRTFDDPPRGLWGGGVRFLRRVRTGDSEFDGDVDLADAGSLVGCLTGPGRVSRGAEDCLCDCRFLDLDHDDDVDLADFARFQNAFTGDQ